MTYPLLVQTTYRAMIIVNTKINVLSSTGPNDLSRYMVHTTLWVLWSKRPPTYPLLVQTTYRAMIIVNTKINVLSSTGPNDLSRYMVHTTLWVLWSKRPPTTCYLNRNWRARSSKGGTPAVNILLDNDPDINMPLYVESSRQSVTNEFQQPCLLMSKGHHGAEGQ